MAGEEPAVLCVLHGSYEPSCMCTRDSMCLHVSHGPWAEEDLGDTGWQVYDGERKDDTLHTQLLCCRGGHGVSPSGQGCSYPARGGRAQIWRGACTLGMCRYCCSRCPCLTLAALRISHFSTDSGSLGGSPLCPPVALCVPQMPSLPEFPLCCPRWTGPPTLGAGEVRV